MVTLSIPLCSRAGLICETEQRPVRVGKDVYVMGVRTYCRDAEQHAELKLLRKCKLLIAAHGPDEGRLRCRALVEASDVELEPRQDVARRRSRR